jgi:NAD(P)-dependent dehydrogenase (short-subunit alcohol dehydrogenase family)
MKTLQDRVAVVTGAASGIGRALALGLAKKGCHLALADVNEVGLRETAQLVAAADTTGRKVTLHTVDVSNRARMEAFPEEVIRAHGHVHLVCNNAGVAVAAAFEDQSLEDFEWLIGINLWGVVYGCKFFLPYLKREPEGHLVNISSVFGLVGIPLQTSYCASKFAVRGFSEALFCELQGTTVGVTSVHPGGINTNIVAAARYAGVPSAFQEKIIRQFKERTMSPDKCAAQIIRAVEKNQMRVLITSETHLADGLKRLFPTATQRLIGWGHRRMNP